MVAIFCKQNLKNLTCGLFTAITNPISHLKTEFYIANKLAKGIKNKKTVAKTVFQIAIIATAVSVTVMLLSVATGLGLQKKIKDNLSALYGHFSIQNFDNNHSDVSIVPIIYSDTIIQKLKQQKLKSFQKTAYKAGIIRTDKTFEGFILKGISDDFNQKLFQEFIVQGDFIKIETQQAQPNNQVLISQTLAQKLELKIGDAFKSFFVKDNEPNKSPNQRNFKIVGIYSTGVKEFDDNHVLADLAHIQRMNKWSKNQVGAIECFTNNFEEANQKANLLYQDLPSNLDVISVQRKFYHVFEWLKIFDFNILIIIVIMMIVSLVNVIVSILVLILENVTLIGVLKAIGYSNKSIQKIFIFQTIKIIIKGLLIGNIIVALIIFIQNKFKIIKLNPENYYVRVAPFQWEILWFLIINLLFIVIIFLSLHLPSLMISRLKPSQLIKFNF